MQEALFFSFNLKKSAAESHRLLQDAYCEHDLSKATCRDWFRRFKSCDFDLNDKERPGQPRKFENEDFEALLDEDRCQILKQLSYTLNVTEMAIRKRLHNLRLVQKAENWLPHELSERQLEMRKTIGEFLLERCKKKSFLLRIVTGDKKWVHY